MLLVIRVFKLRSMKLVLAFIGLVFVSFLVKLASDGLGQSVVHKVESAKKRAVDSYSRQVEIFDKVTRVSKPADDFMSKAYAYKLQVTRGRSERLENIQLNESRSPEAQTEIDTLSDARSIEDEAESVAESLGYGECVAASDGATLRIFIPKSLSVDEVAKLGQAIADSTGLDLGAVTISQKRGAP